MSDCPACGARLETPLGCDACGVLLQPDSDISPFALLGMDPTQAIDKRELKTRLLRISRLTHPDFHGTAPPEERALAEANSAAINVAYEVLLDDFLRADWLVRELGGPSDSDERQMPQEFLMEVLEWNEALDDADSSPEGSAERAKLATVAETLHREHDERLEAIGRALVPLPAPSSPELAGVRRQLNAVRYLSRALYRIRDIRFGKVPNR